MEEIEEFYGVTGRQGKLDKMTLESAGMDLADDELLKDFTVTSIEEQQQKAAETEKKAREMEQDRKSKEKVVEKNAKEIAKEIGKYTKEADAVKKADMDKLRKLEEAKYRRRLLTRIKKYTEAFPTVQELCPKITDKTTIAELEEILDIFKEEMDSAGSVKNLMKKTSIMTKMLEGVIGDGKQLVFLPPPLRLNLTGLSRAFESGLFNDDFVPIMTEIDIEYPWLAGQGLFGRASNAVISMILTVNAMNTNPSFAQMAKATTTAPLKVDLSGLN